MKRIVIPYYIFVIILTGYNVFLGEEIFWNHFLFVDSNTHGLYYLIIYTYSFLFSLLVFYVFQRMPKLFVAGMIGLSSIVFFIITNSFDQFSGVVFLQLPLISFFCWGVIFYFVLSHFAYKTSPFLTIAFLTLGVVTFTVLIYFARKIYGPFPVFVSAPPTVFRLVYCLLIFWCLLCFLQKEVVVTFCKKLGLERFGKISLLIFLIHPYIIKATVPVIKSTYNHFNIDYNTNLFFFTVVIVAYLIVLLTVQVVGVLPQKIYRLFCR